ncbi:MAG TPA: hypothetical protein VFV58_32875 [Blastocatellia bacterium]|jgi:hypothetical protein|nr:hypothetical protein [Blastocatellia bacterium]
MEMVKPDRRNPSPRKQDLDWLNPSSEWAHDEYGAASEPYDWTLKDGEIRPTQVIPITSPVRRRPTKFRWLKRKDDVSESSTTIPLEKSATAKIFGRGITRLIRPAQTGPLIESDRTRPLVEIDRTKPLVESDGTKARRKAPGLALPLLLLAVIALFVFAYIAQK